MTTQIAVKLAEDLVAQVDGLVASGVFPSRSAAVRRGLEVILSAHARLNVDEAFQQGYGAIPETEEEVREAERLAVEAIREEPWEKWW